MYSIQKRLSLHFAEAGCLRCAVLLCERCAIKIIAHLEAHGHLVLCEGADPGTVGGVREDDVLGAELLLRSVDGGIPCGAVHALRPEREVARVVGHLGDDIVVCHDPIKARPLAAHLPHLHKEDVLRTHGENAVCTSKGRQSENTRSVVPFYQRNHIHSAVRSSTISGTISPRRTSTMPLSVSLISGLTGSASVAKDMMALSCR